MALGSLQVPYNVERLVYFASGMDAGLTGELMRGMEAGERKSIPGWVMDKLNGVVKGGGRTRLNVLMIAVVVAAAAVAVVDLLLTIVSQFRVISCDSVHDPYIGSGSYPNADVEWSIADCYKRFAYKICPHTAVAYKYQADNPVTR